MFDKLFKNKKVEMRVVNDDDAKLYRSSADTLVIRDVNLYNDGTGIYRNADGTPLFSALPEPSKPADQYALERLTQSGLVLLGFYFAADTLRKVAVHAAEVKIK